MNEIMDKYKTSNVLKLTSLEIVNGRGCLDLTPLSKACRGLQRLLIYYSMGVQVSLLHSSDDLKFPNLQDLTLYATELRGNYCIPILKSCPNIETLTICQCNELTDDNFFSILDLNPMKNLKEICLLLAPNLTTRTIWTMVTCLDRCVRTILLVQ